MQCDSCLGDVLREDAKIWAGRGVCSQCFAALSQLSDAELSSFPMTIEELVHPRALRNVEVETVVAFALSQGVPAATLKDPIVRKRASDSYWLTMHALNVKEAANRLGIPISDEQAFAIGVNFSVPTVAKRGPLTERDREIAIEIKYHAIKASHRLRPYGQAQSDKTARRAAESNVRFGENGPTVLQELGHRSGCFNLLVLSISAVGCCVVLVSRYLWHS
jgi:hypothetical protein